MIYIYTRIFLFGFYHPSQEIFTHIACEGLQSLTYARHSWTLIKRVTPTVSAEQNLQPFTGNDGMSEKFSSGTKTPKQTKHQRSSGEDRWDLRVLYDFQLHIILERKHYKR